jgi:hypothetical protein
VLGISATWHPLAGESFPERLALLGVIVHLIASALWLAGYLAHQLPLLWSWLSRRRASHGSDFLRRTLNGSERL